MPHNKSGTPKVSKYAAKKRQGISKRGWVSGERSDGQKITLEGQLASGRMGLIPSSHSSANY